MRLGFKIIVGLLYCLHFSGTATSQVSDTTILDSMVNDETKIFEDSMDVLNDFSLDSVDFGFDTSEFAFSQPDTASKDERKMVAGPLFEFGIGNSDEVNINWGNYHYEKESYTKSVERFQRVRNKTVDIYRKLGKSFLSLKVLDSSEYYYKLVADSSTNPIDQYNYSHILYMNEKFEDAENVRKRYADYSDETRAKIFNSVDAHEKIFQNISEIDLINLKDINTKNSDFGAFAVKSDSSDSYNVLYTSADEYSLKNIKRRKYVKPDFLTYDIWKSTFDFSSMKMSSPSPFSGELKNQYQEGPAIFSNDAKNIYFTRSSTIEVEEGNALYLNIFKVKEEHVNIPDSVLGLSINNSDYSVMHPTITKDGNRMYFASDMPGGYGGMDLYYCEIYGLYKQFFLSDTTATRELIRLSRPVNLGDKINTEGNEVFPFHLDDKTLFFASDGRIGFGGLDIYMVNDYLDTNQTEIRNMGIPFNSPKDDFSFFLSKDLKFGFISSNRDGGRGDDDIYSFKTNLEIADGVDDYYTMVKGEVLEMTTSSVLDNDFLNDTLDDFITENLYHKATLTSNPEKGAVQFNEDGTFIYTPQNKDVEEDHFTYQIMHDMFFHDTIHVYIKAIDKTIPVAVDDHYIMKKGQDFTIDEKGGSLHNDSDPGGDKLTTVLVADPLHGDVKFNNDGSFTYHPENILVTSDTFVYAVTDGFYFDTANVILTRLLTGIDLAEVIEINPIYFDLNKSNIRPDAAVELDKIVEVMNEYADMVVELGSHTDCRATVSYNRSLSDRRAKSSANYIRSRISKPERIYGKGYGESKLKNRCECEGRRAVPCSEEEHQENRRTEFVIITMD